MNVRAAVRRMLVFRRSHAADPRWFRVVTFVFAGPLLRRVSRLWLWVFLVALFALGLGFLPLFGVIGFELALASALVAAIAGVDLGARLARELQTMPAPGLARSDWPGRALARSTAAAALLAAAVMAIPAVVSAVRGLWVQTCDWGFGLEAYAALPLATAALAGAAGHLVGVACGPRRALAPVVAQLVVVAVAVAAIARVYAAPGVFTYNAILGYFPGAIYDEYVQLTAPLAWSRLEQLLWVIAAGGALAALLDVPAHRARLRLRRPSGRRTGPVLVAIAAAAAAGVLRWQSGALGYAIDAEDIEEALGGRIETAHFIIHHARTPEIEADLALIAADHEFRYAQVVAQIGEAPAYKIRSFYFATAEQKARLMGARHTEIAKPWRGEIYLTHRAFPHTSLRHEIAHAVAAAFGDPVFGLATKRVLGVPVSVRFGLVEGLAVALDWPNGYDGPSPHELVRALQELGSLPSIDTLLGASFFTVSSGKSYTTAGSFLRFLLDQYGPERLRALYRSGGDFEGVYGMPHRALEAEWRAMIAAIVLPPATVEGSRERFRTGSVFARPCPHAIAERLERAARAVADGDRDEAIDLLRRVCGDAPGEPRYRMRLASLLAGSDRIDHRGEAERLWVRLATDERGTASIRGQAYERLIPAVGGRELAAARPLLARALALPLEPTDRRPLVAMATALDHTGPAGPSLRAYMFPPPPDPAQPSRPTTLELAQAAAAAEPGLGLAHYLVGLQQLARSDWAEAAVALERALGLPLPGPAFVRNAGRYLALAAYRARDRSRLATAIAALSALGGGDRALAADWQARTIFDETGAL